VGASKVILSEAERRLIADADIILTKNSAIEKIVALFGELAESYRSTCSHLLNTNPGHFGIHPKISKGEKHRRLPWVILDYPRTFSKEQGHLAVRTFFWWGNYFSLHLQVSGTFLNPALLALSANKLPAGWVAGLTNDPWELDFPGKTWLGINNKPADGDWYLIVSKKIPITGWETAGVVLCEDYTVLAEIMELVLSTKPVE
jgi:hypothetical protein